MEFNSGNKIAEELDSDGELQLERSGDYIWMPIEEIKYIVDNGQKMIDKHMNHQLSRLTVNPDLCDSCPHLKTTNEDSGEDYNCMAGDYEDCWRLS